MDTGVPGSGDASADDKVGVPAPQLGCVDTTPPVSPLPRNMPADSTESPLASVVASWEMSENTLGLGTFPAMALSLDVGCGARESMALASLSPV